MNLRKKYILKKNIKKWGYSELNRSMVPYFKGSLRFLLIIFIFSPGLLLPSASAHPELTNYVDTSATLKFNQNKAEVEYRVNLSELYAFSEIEKADIDGDLVLNSQESLKYGKFICAELRNNISIANNQLKVTLNLLSHSSVIDITKSEFGTLEIFCKFDGVLKLDSENKVEWSDENFPSPGYRELVVSPGIGVTTDKSYPEISPSRNLSNFSEIKLGEKDIKANFNLYYNAANGNEVKEDKQVEVSKPNSKLDADMVSNKSFGDLTKLYSKLFRVSDLNLTVVLLGFLFALFLGALHSFAPGHGKSTMLLLAVDKDIKRIELYKLAINMAISHTIGVITLGFILYFGFTQSSDLITVVLSIILSIFLIIFGAYVASKRFKDLSENNGNSKSSHWHGGVAHSHHHEGEEENHNHQDHADGHGHSHHHHDVDEGGNHEEHHIGKTKYMSKKNLRFLGLLGGLVPTPSALTLLIGSAALGNILYGVILVIAYGIGMGIVLIIGGYYLNKLFQGIESRRSKSNFYIKLSTYLPITTAIIQIISGVTLLIISIRFLI
jgi:nickel/cobalt exporter